MNAATETGETLAAPAATAIEARPFYWSVRRELWEHRSLYLAPMIAAGVVLFACLLNAIHLPQGMQVLARLDPERQRAAVSGLYGGISLLIALTMAVVTWFYSLDALYGERRDRSILFWKSMPVSDLTVVLAKLFTVMIVAPAIAFVIIVATQLVVLLLGTVIVAVSGGSAAPIWNNLSLFQLTLALLYTLAVSSLWYAPIYGWLLLVSSWAKRSPVLWAVLPLAAIALFESVAFGTKHFARMLQYRFQDGMATAFLPRDHSASVVIGGDRAQANMGIDMPGHVLQVLDPVGFLTNPWLWVGLVVAAAFVAAAVWMRRYREPL
jgi:ABC-2 type transport system permease protein